VDNGIFLDVLDLIDMSALGINNDKQWSEARGSRDRPKEKIGLNVSTWRRGRWGGW
jgi:hypothetical protein